jgi:PHD finger-like domain-containing protein 5A
MALRHSGTDQKMCRRICGVNEGYVCDAHEHRCVICDSVADPEAGAIPVLVCDDCNRSTARDGGSHQCIVCGRTPAPEKATYCRACVLLEKDRDGCPRVENQSRHQRMAQVRGAAS